MESGKVELKIDNSIGTITFSHPKSNSLPGALLRELAETVTAAGKNTKIKVIILASAGEKAFCAGASFDELLSITDFDTGKEFFMGFARVINAMRQCPKFIICRVQGKAVGGGVGLVSAADYALARDTAAVKLSELDLGIGPFVVGPAVERKMGTASFNELAIGTEWREASWAREKGLYADVFSTVEVLDEAVDTMAKKLAEGSMEAMEMLKNILWQGTNHWDAKLEQRAEISGNLVLSDFTKSFIKKFQNK